ncbi:serine/threonine-protein kinase [Saccharopolyspora shandongensis]|uniref:serine/threonine-protein kinase n=1 Tax=Saccharopolyspora shandongensis TaxID=418495 RepID=UPI00340DE538
MIEHMRRGSDFDTYDAWSEARYCRCFIKTPRPDRVDDVDALRRLRLEGKLLLSFTHPHLVRAYEFLRPTDEHPPVLVIETLTGTTLSYLLRDGERLATRDLGYLGQHLCAALRYMHDRGYLHLDIKPGNIIANEGSARIIDLSLARRPGRYHGGTGTPVAMAPEQIRGGMLSSAVDVWGIGLVLYEAATGSQPFDTASASEDETTSSRNGPQRFPQLEFRAPSVRTKRRLPRLLADAIDRCLEPDPQHRPSLSELTAALTAVAGEGRPLSD